MIINVHKNDSPAYEGVPPELYLGAQNDGDRKLLELIEANYVTLGMGRHCDTNEILHVRIALEPKESAAAEER